MAKEYCDTLLALLIKAGNGKTYKFGHKTHIHSIFPGLILTDIPGFENVRDKAGRRIQLRVKDVEYDVHKDVYFINLGVLTMPGISLAEIIGKLEKQWVYCEEVIPESQQEAVNTLYPLPLRHVIATFEDIQRQTD